MILGISKVDSLSIGMRIKEIRKAKKLNQVRLSELLSATQAAISRYESDQQYPGGEFLTQMVSVLGINLNWLLTGEGEMFQAIVPMDASFLGGETIRLPIVAEIAAGQPCEVYNVEPIGYLDIPRALLSFPPPYLVFRILGRSMEPHLLGGDIVVCSEDWQGVDTNGKIMAFRSRDGITIKRLVVDYERETTWLMPINQEFHPVPFTEDSADIQMIGILDLTVRRHNVN